MMRMNTIDWIALILLVIGGINWGLVGFFGWNLIEVAFGGFSVLTRIIYDLVGLSAIWVLLFTFSKTMSD